MIFCGSEFVYSETGRAKDQNSKDARPPRDGDAGFGKGEQDEIHAHDTQSKSKDKSFQFPQCLAFSKKCQKQKIAGNKKHQNQ